MGSDRSPPPRLSLGLRLMRWVLRLGVKPGLALVSGPAGLRSFSVIGATLRFPRRDVRLDPLPDGAGGLAITPASSRAGVRLLWFHGGAYVACSPWTHRGMIVEIARAGRIRAVVPSYRLAPEHAGGAAFEDGLAAARRWMAEGPVILGGDSAGGGLAAAVAAALCAEGQPPAGLVALSPWTDLTGQGASHHDNAGADPMLPTHRMQEIVEMVRGDLPADDPRLSPAFAHYPGLPAAYVSVGSDEILRDDARALVAALTRDGVPVVYRELPQAPHVLAFFAPMLPEARVEVRQIGAWLAARAQALAPGVIR